MKKEYSHIIWDWNGTLFDDVKYAVNIMNKMLTKRNLPIINGIKEYQKIFCFPVIKYYEKLGFDFNKEAFADLAKEFSDTYNKNCDKIDLYNNAEAVLCKIFNKNIKQIILSATQTQNLYLQMSKFNIHHYFDKILGLSSIYAASKIDLARDYLKGTNRTNALMIGDTVHDLEVAESLGIDCVLLSNGHASKESLSVHGLVFEDITEILNMI